MIPADLLVKLSNLGLSSEQYRNVLLLFAPVMDVEHKRREEHRLRTRKWRENKDRVTSQCVTGDSHTETIKEKEIPPVPPKEKENIYIHTHAREAWPSDYREQFWAAYPRKVGKAAAMRKLEQIRGKVPFQRIIDAVRKYCSANHDPKFIKHPETWLNKGCWDDEPSAPIAVVTAPMTGFYASFGSPEQDAWDAFSRKTTGKNLPRDKRGGWQVQTRWPPGHEEVA